MYSDGSEKEVKNTNYYDENNEKEHNFVKKIIVVPEMCGQCYEKLENVLFSLFILFQFINIYLYIYMYLFLE